MTKYLAIKLIFFVVVSLPLVNCLLYRICFPPGTQTRLKWSRAYMKRMNVILYFQYWTNKIEWCKTLIQWLQYFIKRTPN